MITVKESRIRVSRIASRREIRTFLEQANHLIAIGQRYIQQREKTMETVAHLGISLLHVWNEVQRLSVAHYVSGPLEDTNPRFPGSVWVFGVRIDRNPEIHLKL